MLNIFRSFKTFECGISPHQLDKLIGVQNTIFHLRDLPPEFDSKEIKNVLVKNNIEFRTVFKSPGKPVAKIHFLTPDQAREMLEKISMIKLKNRPITITTPDRTVEEQSLSDKRIEEIVVPWWEISYNDQIERKKSKIHEALSKLTRSIIQQYDTNRSNWIKELFSSIIEKGEYKQALTLNEFIPAKIKSGYRNKVSFSIGHDVIKRVCIGFSMGKFKDKIIHLGDPSGIENTSIHPTALHLRQILENYFRNDNILPVFNKATQTGYWRGVEIRTFNSGENSICFQVNKPYPHTKEVFIIIIIIKFRILINFFIFFLFLAI